MTHDEHVNPFLWVWVNPRAAMRSVLGHDHRRQTIILLSACITLGAVLDAVESRTPLFLSVLYVVASSALAILFVHHVYARLLNFVCHSLRGLGELPESRAVVAWQAFVSVGTQAVGLGVTAAVGLLTTNEAVRPFDTPAAQAAGFGVGLAGTIYWIALTSLMIAEAHEFEWWKGLLSALGTGLVLVVAWLLLHMALLSFILTVGLYL